MVCSFWAFSSLQVIWVFGSSLRLVCRFADDVSFEKLMQLPKASDHVSWGQTCSNMQVPEIVDKIYICYMQEF